MNSDRDPQRLFGEYYFMNCCGHPYERAEPWIDHFGGVARRIVTELAPQTALDAGCAIGVLVEMLRDCGVNAYGFDISEFAISKVPEKLKPFIHRDSILNPDAANGKFDVVICIEVLEHLEAQYAEQAIDNLCRWGDQILFSASPDHYDEATHFNVQPPGYWAEKFARRGFLRALDYDASYLVPWAMLFRRQTPIWPMTVNQYETHLWRRFAEAHDLRRVVNQLRAERNRLADEARGGENRINALEAERADLTAKHRAEYDALRTQKDAEQEALVARYTAELEALRAELEAERARRVALREQVEAERAELLAHYERGLAELYTQVETQVSALRGQLQDERDAALTELIEVSRVLDIERGQIALMRGTYGWRSLEVWWRFKNWVFPPGTARLRVYQLVRTALYILFTQGPLAVLKQFYNWLRGERRYARPARR